MGNLATQRPSIAVGAGTVLSAAQAREAVAAGASFVVSPGLSESVVEACRELGVPVLPGVATATDIMRAIGMGLGVLKFFPAEAMGGLPVLRALAAPFGAVRFVPTGGIDASLAGSYLSHPQVAAVGGSWLVPPAAVRAEDFAAIETLARSALAAVPVA